MSLETEATNGADEDQPTVKAAGAVDESRRFPRDFRDIEDAFGVAGLAGLPEPTELLRRYLEAYDSLTATERRISEEQLEELNKSLNSTVARAESLEHERIAILANASTLRVQETALRHQETELVATRAKLGSDLAARRATYGDRLPEERINARAKAAHAFLEALKQQQRLITEIRNAAQVTPRTTVDEEDVRRRLDEIRERWAQATENLKSLTGHVRAIERFGLSKAVSGAIFWIAAAALMAVGCVLGATLSKLPGSPFIAIAAPFANVVAAVIDIPGTHGYFLGVVAIIGSSLVLVLLYSIVLVTFDRLLRRFYGEWWSASKHERHTRRGQLPALWAGGEGRRVVPADFLSRLARLPLIITSLATATAAMALLGIGDATRNWATAIETWTLLTGVAFGVLVAGVVAMLATFWQCATGILSQENLESSTFGRAVIRSFVVPTLAMATVGVIGIPIDVIQRETSVWVMSVSAFTLFAAWTFGIGLCSKTLYRAHDVLESQHHRVDAQYRREVLNEALADKSKLPIALERIQQEVDALWNTPQSENQAGILEYLRPTRRFFRTPQHEDVLDKATLEEYSPADALLEPEILAQLFKNRAELEALRAQLEEIRHEQEATRAATADLEAQSTSLQRARASLIDERAAALRRAELRAANDAKRRIVCELQTAAAYQQGHQIYVRGQRLFSEDSNRNDRDSA